MMGVIVRPVSFSSRKHMSPGLTVRALSIFLRTEREHLPDLRVEDNEAGRLERWERIVQSGHDHRQRQK